ncbi:MAG: PLP-dependent aminotransferase family protein [Pseudomonadota bacterium]
MRFSQRIERLSPSPIREILKVIDQPGMISFAGGLPSAESFPALDCQHLPRDILQYGPSEGEAGLRARIADDLTQRGLTVDADQILVLSGSQQGIDLVAKLLIDNGTRVAVEMPTYLAALQVFSLFGANYAGYHATDHSGLESAAPQLLYTIPTFQNPTGYCYTDSERRALAQRADQLGCVLFEDDPYRDLVYSSCDRTPVCASIKHTSWVYQSSFSKTFAPGLRLGYLACSKDLYAQLAWLKQAADLHSNRLSQTLVLHMLSQPDDRLHQLVQGYREKRDRFQQLLDQTMGQYATWSEPAGGLFFWLTLKPGLQVDVDTLLQRSLQRNVAFMPGTPFFVEPQSTTCLRLNFSHASPAQMEQGLTVLAELVVKS